MAEEIQNICFLTGFEASEKTFECWCSGYAKAEKNFKYMFDKKILSLMKPMRVLAEKNFNFLKIENVQITFCNRYI